MAIRAEAEQQMGLLCDSAVPILCSNRNAHDGNYVCTKCNRMPVEALFVIVKHWKLPECPSIMKKINKACPCQTTEYDAAMVMISNDLQLHVVASHKYSIEPNTKE